MTGRVWVTLSEDVADDFEKPSSEVLDPDPEVDEDFEEEDFTAQQRPLVVSTDSGHERSRSEIHIKAVESLTTTVVETLPQFLNPTSMQKEFDDISRDRAARRADKRGSHFNETVTGIAKLRKTEDADEWKLQAAAECLRSDEWTDSTAADIIGHVTTVVTALPRMTDAIQSLPLIQRVLQKEIARAHIWAYTFAFAHVPSLTRSILLPLKDHMDVAQFLSDGAITEKVREHLDRHPAFVKIIELALCHTQRCHRLQRGRQKKPCIKIGFNDETFADPLAEGIGAAAVFKPLGITLPAARAFALPFRYVEDSFWAGCEMAFRDILLKGLVSPMLKSAASYYHAKSETAVKTAPNTMHAVAWEQARYLVPGAIFHAFAKIVGEEVFGLKTMEPFFTFDKAISELFGSKKPKVDVIWSLEESGSGLFMTALREGLLQHWSTEMEELAREADEETYLAFCECIDGRRIKDAEASGASTVTSKEAIPAAAFSPLTTYDLGAKLANMAGPMEVRPIKESIMSPNQAIDLPTVGLMLRETLRFLNAEKNPGKQLGKKRWEPAHLLLSGLDPVTGKAFDSTARGQVDHFNPARQTWRMLSTLYQILPAKKLTSSLGLTWLMIVMGYGGSERTKQFLLMEPRLPKGPRELLDKFSAAKAAQPPIESFNLAVWGAPCDHFDVAPKRAKALSPGRKAASFWVATPFWVSFIGKKRLGTDPKRWLERHTWMEAYCLIASLNIAPFGKGTLTLFQMCHHLSYYQVIQAPTMEDIVKFMCTGGKGKGALKGLSLLGFVIYIRKT